MLPTKLIMNRNFGCKYEELPVLCGFCAISLARDLDDFTAYSPVFDESYLTAFKARIEAVSKLDQPQSETVGLKIMTMQMYQRLDELVTLVNYLSGYLQLAGHEMPLSAADFGLVQLRNSARSRNVESVLKLLHLVEGNIGKYKTVLIAKGWSEEPMTRLADLWKQLAQDKDRRYLQVSSRAALVQYKQGLLQELYRQLSEICRIGKILYQQTDQAKLKDYTLARMMDQIGRNTKQETVKPIGSIKKIV
jgi:hypothetical protein